MVGFGAKAFVFESFVVASNLSLHAAAELMVLKFALGLKARSAFLSDPMSRHLASASRGREKS